MKTTEGNKLIAKFMGNPLLQWNDPDPIEGNDYNVVFIKPVHPESNEVFLIHYGSDVELLSEAEVYRHELIPIEPLYHESWDWLMPVVDKCTQVGFRDQEEENEFTAKWDEVFDNFGMFLGNHIDEVWEAVIEFIEWYNKNNDKS